VPAEVAARFGTDDLSRIPFLTLLARSGPAATRAEQTLTATLADPHVARLLAVDAGAPLLRKTRVVWDADGRALEHIDVLYRPDMYQVRLTMTRDPDAAGDWSAG
jgi:GntR family transcriptional regulator